MNRRLVGILVSLLLCLSVVGAFAAQKSDSIPWWISMNTPGQMNVAVGGGYTYYGFGVDASAIFTFGEFAIGPIPFSWGVTALADVGFTYGMGIGAGAFAALETSWDFGSIWKFTWQAGIGPAIGFGISGYYASDAGFGIGLGSYESSAWWFSDNMALVGQYAYMWSFFGPGMYAYTLGVEFKF
jgi:hypothetical protein